MSNKHNKNQTVENIEETTTQTESASDQTGMEPVKPTLLQRGKTWFVEHKEGIKKHAKRVGIGAAIAFGALVGINEYAKRNGSDEIEGEEDLSDYSEIPETEPSEET